MLSATVAVCILLRMCSVGPTLSALYSVGEVFALLERAPEDEHHESSILTSSDMPFSSDRYTVVLSTKRDTLTSSSSLFWTFYACGFFICCANRGLSILPRSVVRYFCCLRWLMCRLFSSWWLGVGLGLSYDETTTSTHPILFLSVLFFALVCHWKAGFWMSRLCRYTATLLQKVPKICIPRNIGEVR